MFKLTPVKLLLPFTLVTTLTVGHSLTLSQAQAMAIVILEENLVQATNGHNQEERQSAWDKIRDIFRRPSQDGSSS